MTQPRQGTSTILALLACSASFHVLARESIDLADIQQTQRPQRIQRFLDAEQRPGANVITPSRVNISISYSTSCSTSYSTSYDSDATDETDSTGNGRSRPPSTLVQVEGQLGAIQGREGPEGRTGREGGEDREGRATFVAFSGVEMDFELFTPGPSTSHRDSASGFDCDQHTGKQDDQGQHGTDFTLSLELESWITQMQTVTLQILRQPVDSAAPAPLTYSLDINLLDMNLLDMNLVDTDLFEGDAVPTDRRQKVKLSARLSDFRQSRRGQWSGGFFQPDWVNEIQAVRLFFKRSKNQPHRTEPLTYSFRFSTSLLSICSSQPNKI